MDTKSLLGNTGEAKDKCSLVKFVVINLCGAAGNIVQACLPVHEK
jgi:hypothetical protein